MDKYEREETRHFIIYVLRNKPQAMGVQSDRRPLTHPSGSCFRHDH